MARAQFRLAKNAVSQADRTDSVNGQFPHFSRLFSATAVSRGVFWAERIALWSLVVVLFGLNTQASLSSDRNKTNAFLPVFRDPMSAGAHTQTALLLWKSGLAKQARNEIAIAQDLLAESPAVLGAATDPTRILSAWEAEPIEWQKQVDYWKQITTDKSDYRDAYLQLGGLMYQHGDKAGANRYWQKAHTLDPNDPQTNALLGLL